MRDGKKEQRPNPITPPGQGVPVSIFTETQTRARTFPTLQFSSLLKVLLVFVIPRSFAGFGEWARLLVLPYDTCRAYNERMESIVSAERAYWTVP